MSDDEFVPLEEHERVHSWWSGEAGVISLVGMDEDGVDTTEGLTLVCGCCGERHFFPAPFALYVAACVRTAARERNWTMGDQWTIEDGDLPTLGLEDDGG